MYFHQATKDRPILLIPGIHYFDAHRLQPLLLQAPALQVHRRESPLVGPEGAGETVDDPSSEEEQATTASETEAESEDDDEGTPPEEPWCPPIPPAMDDPTEQEIKGANLRNPWVSVQDVVLNSLEPSTLPSQPLPELSHFYQTHKQQGERCLAHVAMVLVGVSRLDTK